MSMTTHWNHTQLWKKLMLSFEREYAFLVNRVLNAGEKRETRAGKARSLFGEVLTIDLHDTVTVPLIQGRQMFTKGIIGEFKTFMQMAAVYSGRKTEHISGLVSLEQFEKNGCNYWKQWAEDGFLSLDYGSQWNAGGQLGHVVRCLQGNQTDRRMLINSWVPDNIELDVLSLPCCHYAYQFYVREGKFVDILWHQRSTDVMVGLPSDIMLAWLWLVHLGSLTGLVPGCIRMTLGDTHVYENHVEQARVYVDRAEGKEILNLARPTYAYTHKPSNIFDFNPDGLIINSDHLGKLNFKVLG